VTGAFQVSTTLATQSAAAEMAAVLVQERLAACVQILGPVESVYRWKGAVEHATEWLCLAKTVEPKLEALLARVRALHSYEQPEIIAVPIAGADAGYLEWLRRETTAQPGSPR
jgi:periplasmic divalent cation tolerance protein